MGGIPFFSANCALALLLSALGFGKAGGETNGGDGRVEDGEWECGECGGGEEDDHDEYDDDTADNLAHPSPPSALLSGGLLGVDLYISAVLHGDGTGGDGAELRRRCRGRGGVNGAGDPGHPVEERGALWERRAGDTDTIPPREGERVVVPPDEQQGRPSSSTFSLSTSSSTCPKRSWWVATAWPLHVAAAAAAGAAAAGRFARALLRVRFLRAACTALEENAANCGGVREKRGGEGVLLAALRMGAVAAVLLVSTDQDSEAGTGGAGTELLEENTARRSLKVSRGGLLSVVGVVSPPGKFSAVPAAAAAAGAAAADAAATTVVGLRRVLSVAVFAVVFPGETGCWSLFCSSLPPPPSLSPPMLLLPLSSSSPRLR